MGDMGMYKWCLRMEEHKRKGNHIIKYPQQDVRKSVDDMEQDLLLKDRRASFWEQNRRIPTTDDLNWWESEEAT
jgi:hypothetical protein